MATTAETSPAPVRPERDTRPRRAQLVGRARDAADLARSTRVGRLTVAGAATVVLVLLAGALALVAVLRVDAASSDVVTRSGPLTAAAQELYRALSDADAAAAEGFLAGSAEPPEVRLRYQTDITAAGAALAAATRATAVPASAADDPATRLATGLPVYTGTVETARTFDRQRVSVGAGYLREASSFLQTTLLPAARAIYDEQSAELADQQAVADGDAVTVLAALAVAGALVAVVALHRRVAGTTKRRVTPGLVLAAAALGLALVWGVAAVGAASLLMHSAAGHGSTPNRGAVASRFAVLQSRGDDILTLVARGAGASYEASYTDRSLRYLGWRGDLQQAQEATDDPGVAADLADARTAAYAAITVHNRVRSLDAAGNVDEAVVLALSSAPDGGSATVAGTGEALGRAIDATGQSAATDASAASAAMTLLALGVVVLTLVAVGGVVAGLWPRLQEYR